MGAQTALQGSPVDRRGGSTVGIPTNPLAEVQPISSEGVTERRKAKTVRLSRQGGSEIRGKYCPVSTSICTRIISTPATAVQMPRSQRVTPISLASPPFGGSAVSRREPRGGWGHPGGPVLPPSVTRQPRSPEAGLQGHASTPSEMDQHPLGPRMGYRGVQLPPARVSIIFNKPMRHQVCTVE